MTLSKEIQITSKNGAVYKIFLFNIFYIEIITRDKRIIYLSRPIDNVESIESHGRICNSGLLFHSLGLGSDHFIQTHQKYIIPKFRAIGRDAKWRYLHIKTTVTTHSPTPNEMFRTKELPIGAAYLKNVKEFFFNDDSRVMFRNKPDKDVDVEHVYVFIDSITHIASNNASYKRTIYLDSPISYIHNCYEIVEHSNKPLASYINHLSTYPIHFRVHQSYIVNFLSVISRDKHWKYLVIRAFDSEHKEKTKIHIPIGRSFKEEVKKLFENIAIDE